MNSFKIFFTLFCFYNFTFAQPQNTQIIKHLPTQQRVIALTFDACETHKPARYDAKIIQILRQTKTSATLLLCGRWMLSHQKQTKALAADPLFEIGSHSYDHPHFTKLTPTKMREEILQTQQVQKQLTGRQGKLFRPPYGEYNNQVVKVAAKLHLKMLLWDIVTGDPDKRQSAKAIESVVLTRAKPGSIVIMHVNGRGWHTAEALPNIIKKLKKRGFKFVQVSDIIKR